MKKRILCLLMALLLLAVPALADEEDAEAAEPRFVRTKTYSGQFSDLEPGSVFYDNVAALYEYGLSTGKTDGTYGLKDNISVSQVIIFAGRIRSLYRTGDSEAGPDAYYAPGPIVGRYLQYLQAEGVLGDELNDVLFESATRAQMAHVLAAILPESELPKINDEVVTEGYAMRRFITDVTEDTPYYREILYLYRCGISNGADATGSFRPDALITRGAVAAMLTRMVDPALRITLNWKLRPALEITYGDLVEPGEYIRTPLVAADYDLSVRDMLSREEDRLEFYLPEITREKAQEATVQALSAVKAYCEQGYNYVTYSFTEDGMLYLTFSMSCDRPGTQALRAAALEEAITVHDQLWMTGEITEDMSEWDKAWIYYNWIAANCAYDAEATATSESHTAYGLFTNHLAVCDGYTGAYNLLLKMEGIDCSTIFTSEHAWTEAILDGDLLHIDATWGDFGSSGNVRYFAMTPQEAYRIHSEESGT